MNMSTNAPRPSPLATPPSKADVVSQIDRTLAASASLSTADGLTLAVLASGGATIVWYVVSDPSLRGVLEPSAIRLYILLWLLIRIASAIWRFVFGDRAHGTEPRPRLVSAWARKMQFGPIMLADAIHGVALAIGVVTLFNVPMLLRIPIAGLCLLETIGFIGLYVVLRDSDWIPNALGKFELTPRGNFIVGGVVLMWLTCILAAFGTALLAMRGGLGTFDFEDFRSTLAILSVIIILRMICARVAAQQYLKYMLTLRNDIEFDLVDPAVGLAYAKVLVAGGDVAELIRPELERIRTIAADYSNTLRIYTKLLDIIATEFSDPATKTILKSDIREKLGDDYQHLAEQKEIASRNIRDSRRWEGQMLRKLRLAQLVFGTTAEAMSLLDDEIASFRGRCAESRAEVRKSAGRLKRLLEARHLDIDV